MLADLAGSRVAIRAIKTNSKVTMANVPESFAPMPNNWLDRTRVAARAAIKPRVVP